MGLEKNDINNITSYEESTHQRRTPKSAPPPIFKHTNKQTNYQADYSFVCLFAEKC